MADFLPAKERPVGLSRTGQTYIAVNSVLPSFAILAVCLRLYAKRFKSVAGLAADDYTIIGSLGLALVVSAAGIYSALEDYVGLSFEIYTAEELKNRARLYLIEYTIGHFLFGLVKISVVLWYKRLFDVPRFILAANIILGVVAVWMVATFAVGFVVHREMEKMWVTIPLLFTDSPEGFYRSRFAAIYLSVSLLVNLFLDVAIISMPIPMINMLKLPLRKKVPVFGMFALGIFCTGSSAVRLKYLVDLIRLDPRDPYWGHAVDYQSLWGHVEVCASIIAACLPMLGLLFRRRQEGNAPKKSPSDHDLLPLSKNVH